MYINKKLTRILNRRFVSNIPRGPKRTHKNLLSSRPETFDFSDLRKNDNKESKNLENDITNGKKIENKQTELKGDNESSQKDSKQVNLIGVREIIHCCDNASTSNTKNNNQKRRRNSYTRASFIKIPKIEEKRYTYNKQNNSVTDELRITTKPLWCMDQTNVEIKQTNLNILSKTLDKFPICLVLKSKSSVFAYNLKKIVDWIEKFNQVSVNDSELKDPNEYELLVDYHVTDKLNVFEKYLLVNNEETEIDTSFLNKFPKSPLLIISFTETGFKQNINFFKGFQSSGYDKLFDIDACIMNVGNFPILKSIKEEKRSALSDVERKIMKENFYEIASLGLVKVSKKDNGTLVLTKKSI